MENIFEIFLGAFALVVVLTNVLVNVFKSIFCFKDETKTKRCVVLTSIVLCIIAGIGVGMYQGFNVWYLWGADVIGSIIVGFIASWVAMAGYDNLYDQLVAILKNIIDVLIGSGITKGK